MTISFLISYPIQRLGFTVPLALLARADEVIKQHKVFRLRGQALLHTRLD